jgi:maltose/maltodextrin transport system permease protein
MSAQLSPQSMADAGAAWPLPELVAHLPELRTLRLQLADGAELRLKSLREFAPLRPLYVAQPDGSLQHQLSGKLLRPNTRTGFFEAADGERVAPGFRVGVGLQNYQRIFTDPQFSQPFARVFVWTVAFAALTVVFTGALGMLLAVLLGWEALRGRAAYRLVLFLPYAVPGFISILVFKGLFNQNLGEINLVLNQLFGIRPAWFSDPLLAKVMLLIVNTWLGFPYMMVLCSGLIKAIPADLYEASAVQGAGPLANFWFITLPLVVKPLTPLLIAAFAFNFNNFVLISLLTEGRPDFLDASVPAGTTDLLVSYTWRIAFEDTGQQFGLAAALSTVIFVLVAAMTLVQMRFTRVAEAAPRR